MNTFTLHYDQFRVRNDHCGEKLVRSLRQRIEAYYEVKRLSLKCHSVAEISSETGVSDGTIRGWLVNGRKPWTRYDLFQPLASEELSYVTGVYMGDGSISRQGHRLVLRLHVKDEEFADQFASTCAQILAKKRYSVRHVPHRNAYDTSIPNTSLCGFLEQGLSKLDSYIREHPSGFVRGLADSDGCPAVTTTSKRGKPWFFVQVVVATSPSLSLLSYTRRILRECFGITATLVYKGRPQPRSYKGSIFHSKKRVFDLRISRLRDVEEFRKRIGFGLSRKQVKLDSAMKVRSLLGSGREAVEEWKRHWQLGETEWVQRTGGV